MMIDDREGGVDWDVSDDNDGDGSEDDDEAAGELFSLGCSAVCVWAATQSNNRSLINHSLLFRPITFETGAHVNSEWWKRRRSDFRPRN